MVCVAELLAAADTLPGDEARREIEVLLCAALQKPRSYLFAWPEAEVPKDHERCFRDWLAQRVAGVPLAYLLGEREFWSLSLGVDSSTLIPRPETELLVELALGLDLPATARVLDLGTGSGAIALALASERSSWSVTGVDSSQTALNRASLNSAKNSAKLQLTQMRWLAGSWFEPLAGERFELIVSNPPYLAQGDPHLQEGDLRFEPSAALVAGETGLEDLQRIIAAAPEHLSTGGWLLLEHGWEQGHAVCALLRQRGFAAVLSHDDLAGRPRVSVGCWLPEGHADAE